jgi:hypothetical protein
MKIWKFFLAICFMLTSLAIISRAFADQISPTSYDMINGGTASGGTPTLRDDTYTGGTGPKGNYQSLSGGKGDLTDGIVSPGVWWQGQTMADPYVGWQQASLLNPEITFHFSNSTTFSQVAVHMVRQYRPGSVDITIGGNPLQHFATFDLIGIDHEWVNFPINNLVGSTIVLKLNDNTYSWDTDWIMIDEVTFQGTSSLTSVPEPATMLLLGFGLVGLAGYGRRKIRSGKGKTSQEEG